MNVRTYNRSRMMSAAKPVKVPVMARIEGALVEVSIGPAGVDPGFSPDVGELIFALEFWRGLQGWTADISLTIPSANPMVIDRADPADPADRHQESSSSSG
jgi:hypothetical protein